MMSQNLTVSVVAVRSIQSAVPRRPEYRFHRFLALIVTIMWLSGFARAQAVNQDGFKPYGSYQGSDIDTVNLSNGHVDLQLPIVGYPQRGGKLGLNFMVRYDASHWYESMDCSKGPQFGCIFQWKGGGGRLRLGWEQIGDVRSFLGQTGSVTLPDGSVHPMGWVT